MNPTFAHGESLAEPLEEILLELSDFSRAHLILAVVDHETVRREAMAELGERLSGRCLLHEFDFSQPPPRSLPRFCRTLAKQHPFCVFAYGLEKLLEKAEQAEREGKAEEAEQAKRAYDESLAFLNMHREDIALSKASVVLWVTTATYADLLSKAGDFWAWRTADVKFELPPNVTIRPTALGQLPLEDAEDLRQQAHRIEEILNHPDHPNPAVIADLRHQLGEIRRQLGQQEESELQYAKATATLIQLGDDRRLRDLYCERLIAAHEYLDFRGILQVRQILKLRIEDLYVPLWATIEARDIRSALRPPMPPSWRERSRTGTEAESEEALFRELEQVERIPERRVEVAQALREQMRLVVLGDPGTGKSMLLKLLALTFARGREYTRQTFQLDEDRLPLLIPIAAYGDAVTQSPQLDFADFLSQRLIADGLRDPTVARRALDKGECLLLLDGLDEVLDPNRRIYVSQQIKRFIDGCNPRNRIVVTSRIAGYQHVGFAGDFTHLTLLPFGDDEIKAFARNWARAYESSPNPTAGWERRAEQLAQQLTESILSTPEIQRLAANPLLVTILALIHRQGTQLPHQRVELYRLCVEALAEHWQRARSLYRPIDLYLGTRRLDESYVVGTLAPIAFWLFETRTRPTGLLHRTELEQQIADRLVAQEGIKEADAPSLAHEFVELIREQSGLLIERGADLFDFLHPTFKEYLAARHLAERRNPLELLGERLFAPRWREIVLLTAGMLKGDHLDDFLNGILQSGTEYDKQLQRPLLLAARCLADDVPASASLRRQLRDDLFAQWRRPPFARLRDEIMQTFAYMKGSIIGPDVFDFLLYIVHDRSEDEWVCRGTVWALGQAGQGEPQVMKILLRVANDPSLRDAALDALWDISMRAKEELSLPPTIESSRQPKRLRL